MTALRHRAEFSTCHSLGVCETVLRKTFGLPVLSGGGGKILSFLSNKAMGYGDDVASAPTDLILSGTSVTAYVPGQTSLMHLRVQWLLNKYQ